METMQLLSNVRGVTVVYEPVTLPKPFENVISCIIKLKVLNLLEDTSKEFTVAIKDKNGKIRATLKVKHEGFEEIKKMLSPMFVMSLN